MKQSCILYIREHENGGIVGQARNDEVFSVFSF
jgi:hypothetical protein